MKAVIFCDIPEKFKCMVHAFYSQAFQAYQSINRKESGKMDTSGIGKSSIKLVIWCLFTYSHIELFIM